MMYLIVALIILSVVVSATVASRWSLPVIMVALGGGMLFGSDMLGLIYFDDAKLTNEVANMALMFILFVGGFGTKRENFRRNLGPSMTLATVGVLISTFVTGLALHLCLGVSMQYALMGGAIVASTDAAAVFSILRTRPLSQRCSSTIEIESAANDPMAIILTTLMVGIVANKSGGHGMVLAHFFWQLLGGLLIGVGGGKLGVALFNRIQTNDRGFFYVLILGVIIFVYGLADTVQASGVLAVFFAGYIMGNEDFVYKRGVATFLDALSMIANVGLFVLLGLLAFPSKFGDIWDDGLLVFCVLTFLARPMSVFICTAPFLFSFKERVFISWCGVRGAVPIVLATYPAAAGIPWGDQIFNITFFAVGLSILVQGSTIGKFASFLKLTVRAKPKPRHVVELFTTGQCDLDVFELEIDDEVCHGSATVAELALPPGVTIMMVNRGNAIIAPKGSTEIFPDDTLFILCDPAVVSSVSRHIFAAFARREPPSPAPELAQA